MAATEKPIKKIIVTRIANVIFVAGPIIIAVILLLIFSKEANTNLYAWGLKVNKTYSWAEIQALKENNEFLYNFLDELKRHENELNPPESIDSIERIQHQIMQRINESSIFLKKIEEYSDSSSEKQEMLLEEIAEFLSTDKSKVIAVEWGIKRNKQLFIKLYDSVAKINSSKVNLLSEFQSLTDSLTLYKNKSKSLIAQLEKKGKDTVIVKVNDTRKEDSLLDVIKVLSKPKENIRVVALEFMPQGAKRRNDGTYILKQVRSRGIRLSCTITDINRVASGQKSFEVIFGYPTNDNKLETVTMVRVIGLGKEFKDKVSIKDFGPGEYSCEIIYNGVSLQKATFMVR